MHRMLAILAAMTWLGAVQAQATSAPPPPAQHSPGQTAAPTAKPPQRGNIAPILDIRIQDQGISVPKPREDVPPEKPPAK
jgi:hypothetical protein